MAWCIYILISRLFEEYLGKRTNMPLANVKTTMRYWRRSSKYQQRLYFQPSRNKNYGRKNENITRRLRSRRRLRDSGRRSGGCPCNTFSWAQRRKQIYKVPKCVKNSRRRKRLIMIYGSMAWLHRSRFFLENRTCCHMPNARLMSFLRAVCPVGVAAPS